MVKKLIRNDYDVFEQFEDGQNLFSLALEFGQADIVQLLLDEHGADPNATKDLWNQAPLMIAVQNGHEEVVQLLLDHGADVNKEDLGYTPLRIACEHKHLDIAQLLLDGGAHINQGDLTFCSKTPLQQACVAGELEVIQFLLAQGARTNDSNLLHYAVESEKLDVIQFLLDQGVNPKEHAADGSTPFQIACTRRSLEVIQLLLEQEVDPNLTDNYERTPLHFAAAHGQLDVIRFLLDQGVNPNLTDQNGKTPLYNAVIHNYPQVIQLLLQHGAKLQDIRHLDLLFETANVKPSIHEFLSTHKEALCEIFGEKLTTADIQEDANGPFIPREIVMRNPGGDTLRFSMQVYGEDGVLKAKLSTSPAQLSPMEDSSCFDKFLAEASNICFARVHTPVPTEPEFAAAVVAEADASGAADDAPNYTPLIFSKKVFMHFIKGKVGIPMDSLRPFISPEGNISVLLPIDDTDIGRWKQCGAEHI